MAEFAWASSHLPELRQEDWDRLGQLWQDTGGAVVPSLGHPGRSERGDRSASAIRTWGKTPGMQVGISLLAVSRPSISRASHGRPVFDAEVCPDFCPSYTAQASMAASRLPPGTSVLPPLVTLLHGPRPPHWPDPAQSPPRTDADPRGAPPLAGPATATPLAMLGPSAAAEPSSQPLRHGVATTI